MAEAAGVGVLDASVAVKLVVNEPGTPESVGLIEQPVRWLAPRLLVTEVASALRRKAEGGDLSPLHATSALAALLDAVDDGVIRLAQDEELAPAALTLALTLGHKVPDCVYLALAEREGAVLASADRKLIAAARSRGVLVTEVPSSW
ncbi:MAG: type II toxin-antitoxin system VapC family toxin [Vicinamibacterales bacterium]